MKDIIKIDGLKINRALLYGAVIWATMFIVASIVVGYGFGDWTKYGIMWLFSIAFSWIIATRLKINDIKTAFYYGLIFVVLGVILDLLISVRFTGTAIFSSFDYWVGYGLTFLTVLFRGYSSK
ncbi:MAG: hypothetical protein UR93_C0008G0020 [Berkelbacteria bacterium GW2011_GWA2_35_9]|uniref:Uncharacterized protein n=1 Tax=Berkelbacteria bacterium GW2011_GWA2_35_9 TaxID=1618333 RepID=A0A0G0DJ19_9BACT|nr:MAG: hypothetical protein UR93_C0008G0020 [Berkelbacteria bacterium GW2011_GWA2_35_9]